MKLLLRLWAWLLSFLPNVRNIVDDEVPMTVTPAPYVPEVRRAVDETNFHKRANDSLKELRAFYNRRPRPWRMRGSR